MLEYLHGRFYGLYWFDFAYIPITLLILILYDIYIDLDIDILYI